MIVADLTKINDINLLTEDIELNNNIKDIYAGDLLSFVMGHIKERNTLFLTILNSINVLAVASLLEMSAVVFCDGVIPDPEIIKKAKEEKLPIFSTTLSSVKIAKEIYESLL